MRYRTGHVKLALKGATQYRLPEPARLAGQLVAAVSKTR